MILFFINDLKLNASGQRELQTIMHAGRMKIGMGKWVLKRGRCEKCREKDQLGDRSILRYNDAGETHAYL